MPKVALASHIRSNPVKLPVIGQFLSAWSSQRQYLVGQFLSLRSSYKPVIYDSFASSTAVCT